ncbi:MAG TPA: PHB depolymerase family esterase [Gemmataceae bacterium]|nr:PHB depolymerase family esterase [Gemmataceae bacterium]
MHVRLFRIPRLRGALGILLSGVLCLLCSWNANSADLVIFKDGYTLQGKIKRETTYFIDPASGVQMQVPKLNGFFTVDDEARKIAFSPLQVQEVPDKDPAREADPIRLKSPIVRRSRFKVPPWQVTAVTDWNSKWDRVLTINTPDGRRQVPQHLTLLTPKIASVDARDYEWKTYYLTQELDPKTVRTLLTQHPELKLTGDSTDAGKRFRIFHFLVQAGWYDKAAAELDGILRDSPDQKDKVEAAREELKKLLAWQYVDLLEEAHKNGRHHWVQARLAIFPQQGLEEKLIARVDVMRGTYETINKNLVLARGLLDECSARLTDPVHGKLFKEAAAAIELELNPDTVSRLEAFLKLAEQAKLEIQRNRTPEHTPEQLLTLAMSGWLLGSNSAEANVETGVRLWRARQFVLDYQKTHNSGSRQQMVTAYDSKQGVPFDELAQLIRSLPPPEPLESAFLKNGPWAAGALPFRPAALYWALSAIYKLLPPTTLSLHAEFPLSYRKGPSYFLRLPPEYHHGRSYPVLFVLHEGGEKPEEMLKRWSTLAAQHGYILVAPEWRTGSGDSYGYTAEEHRAVLDVLRDLRQRLEVDSDRVFLFGLGEGGKMAYDVGLAHPDLFAGVLLMGGAPHYFAKAYKQNAQYLPFYVVDGDYDGDTAKENRLQFEYWIGHSYPAISVQYRGRGREWFEGEVPFMFDWMSRKKRSAAFPQLGRSGTGAGYGEEFRSMRPTDNHFYWLSGDGLLDRHINSAQKWSGTLGPALLQAARSSEGNHLTVNAHGFKKVAIWLGPGMIDFEKPLMIHLNGRIQSSNRKIQPNLGTLLEDFYQRGDRQRLFYAKVEFAP